MSFSTTLQSYVGTHTATSSHGQCAIDWGRNRLFTVGAVSTTYYLTRYGLLSGLEETFQATAAYGSTSAIGNVGLDGNGQIYAVKPSGNYGGVLQISGDTLVPLGQWGVYSATDNIPYGIPQTNQFTNVVNGSTQYLLSAAEGGIAPHYVSLLNASNIGTLTTAYGGLYSSWNGPDALICPGADGSNLGFMVSGPNSSIDAQTLYFYSILCSSAPTSTNFTTMVPTDVDSTWTQIYAGGICVDQTDGNLLVSVSGQSGAAQPSYLLKIHSVSGAILWSVAVPGAAGGAMMSFSRVKYSRFAIFHYGGISGTNSVTVVNTAAGTSTSFTSSLAGLQITGLQAFNDTSGLLVMNGSFSKTTGSPSLLNSTPTSFTGWMGLYVLGAGGGSGGGTAPGKACYTRVRTMFSNA